MKRIISILLMLCLCFTLCACGEKPEASENNSEVTEPKQSETKTEGKKEELADNFDTETSALKCIGIEAANLGLSDYKKDNIWIVKFEFTNKEAVPVEASDAYSFDFYQNNIELETLSVTYSTGGEHYELCSNRHKGVMNGATITCAVPVELTDSTSPVVVYMKEANKNNIATVTLDLVK